VGRSFGGRSAAAHSASLARDEGSTSESIAAAMSRLAASIAAFALPMESRVEVRALAAWVVSSEPIGDQSERIQSRASNRLPEVDAVEPQIRELLRLHHGRASIMSGHTGRSCPRITAWISSAPHPPRRSIRVF
jgi:hypothetical protein